jgi:hypothetical protein
MAIFTLKIVEQLTLNGDDVGSSVTQTINNINFMDNRILNVPTGSITTIFSLDNLPGAGTFVSSSFQYGRVTNNSTTAPVKLIVSSSTEAMSFLIATGSSFMLSTSKITGSTSGLNFNDIRSIKVEPSGSIASIEYYVITN